MESWGERREGKSGMGWGEGLVMSVRGGWAGMSVSEQLTHFLLKARQHSF